MDNLQNLRQHVQTLLKVDHTPAEDWPPLALVPEAPRAAWNWLPGVLAGSGTEWLPKVVSAVDVTALKAGLLLMHDFMDESHGAAQSIEGQGAGRLGDYWHAILHRREPDYTNAKYWFRQIGTQSLFGELARRADQVLTATTSAAVQEWRQRLGCPERWNPLAFVDLCEAAQQERGTDLTAVAQTLQRLEMSLLFRQTYRQATGQDA